MHNRCAEAGFTLLELLIATALAATLLASIAGIASRAFETRDLVEQRLTLQRDARFALQQMTRAVAESRHLLLPLPDSPKTNWRENLREQSVPPEPPEGDSKLATAVLAVTQSPNADLDGDGWADANNDRDYMDRNNNGFRDAGEEERIDEDLGEDATNDKAPGIIGIDDNGNGEVDETAGLSADKDNDEDGEVNEDMLDGIDNDGDGAIDEDLPDDMNDDGASGVSGYDDDFDLLVDEEDRRDDDEDGLRDEDGYDPVVFFLAGNTLIQRLPVPWDENADGKLDGLDFVETAIAENVSRFRVERLPRSLSGAQLVALELELTDASGESVTLRTQLRVGAAL
ncbi:MAG: prepilin-type N-terminal cleavage/methylation domain-containing protein [Woeseia sp.]